SAPEEGGGHDPDRLEPRHESRPGRRDPHRHPGLLLAARLPATSAMKNALASLEALVVYRNARPLNGQQVAEELWSPPTSHASHYLTPRQHLQGRFEVSRVTPLLK